MYWECWHVNWTDDLINSGSGSASWPPVWFGVVGRCCCLLDNASGHGNASAHWWGIVMRHMSGLQRACVRACTHSARECVCVNKAMCQHMHLATCGQAGHWQVSSVPHDQSVGGQRGACWAAVQAAQAPDDDEKHTWRRVAGVACQL